MPEGLSLCSFSSQLVTITSCFYRSKIVLNNRSLNGRRSWNNTIYNLALCQIFWVLDRSNLRLSSNQWCLIYLLTIALLILFAAYYFEFLHNCATLAHLFLNGIHNIINIMAQLCKLFIFDFFSNYFFWIKYLFVCNQDMLTGVFCNFLECC